MIVAGIDLLAGDQIGNIKVMAAAPTLVGDRQQAIVAGAVPAVRHRRRMQAGPAITLGGGALMAEVMMFAQPALPLGRIARQPFRRPGSVDDPARLDQQGFARGGIGRQALDVNLVGVLAHR